MKIGIIGCGNISGIYFKNLTKGLWPRAELIACADLDLSRAHAYEKEYSQIKAMSVDALIESDQIELVINLTIPQAHYPVALKCIKAGKHHYSEKPMALSSIESEEIIEEAKKHNVLVGCAPDTFLGAGVQTAVQAIQNGKIGKPVSVMGHLFCQGHESWHPSPEFYYQKGGGPLMDMGPYYLTAMVAMLGKVKKVKSFNRTTFETRTITSEPNKGKIIPVEVPTHNTALLDFECGAVGTLITSFDSKSPALPNIVVVGTEGTLRVPDPNNFWGDVILNNADFQDEKLSPVNEYTENSRGIGVANMIDAIHSGTTPGANGDLASHVLKTMERILADD